MFDKKQKRYSLNDSISFINKKHTQESICSLYNTFNIKKQFNQSKALLWEEFIHTQLKNTKSNFIPDTIFDKNSCIYNLDNLVSLRHFLKTHKQHFTFIINEIFSYTCSFYSNYFFIHGNLHIDNIFINENTFFNRPCFFVIDYSNSYLLNEPFRHSMPLYKRSSFLFEYDIKLYDSNIIYWDIFTLFLSLKTFINLLDFSKNSNKYITQLYNSVYLFIPKSLLDSMIHSYVNSENIDTLYNFLENQ